MLIAINRCAVGQRHVEVGGMGAAEQCTVVSQKAPAQRDRSVNGELVEVMIAIMLVLDTPGIAADDAVQTLYGVDDGSGSLAQETLEASFAVVKDGEAQTVGHFTDSHSAAAGGYHVIDGWWLCLAQEFPHERTAQGVGSRLPERQSVGAGSVEVEVAVIRMGKQVGDEEVVVPHHAVGKVALQRVQGGLGEVGVQGPAVEQLHPHIDSRCFGCSPPVAFLHGQCHCRVGEDECLPFGFPRMHPRVVLVTWLAEGDTQLHQRTVTIGLITVVVACHSPTHRGKSA